MEGKDISSLLKLGEEGQIKILMPIITQSEIYRKAEKNLGEAISKYNNSRDTYRLLRNVDSVQAVFRVPKIDEEQRKNIVDEFKNKLSSEFLKAKIEVIEYPKIEISGIFDKYFSDKPPFHKESKKNEFPDAFALAILEEECKKRGVKCHVLSGDSDILKYESCSLIIEIDYKDFLERKIRRVEAEKHRSQRLNKAIKLFESKNEVIEQNVKDWLSYQLDDTYKYSKYFGVEVFNYNVDVCEAQVEEYRIVDSGLHGLTLEVKVKISYVVEVEIGDENDVIYNAMYDEWEYIGTTTQKLESVEFIPVIVKVEVPLAGEEFMDVITEQINDNQELRFK